MKRLSYILVSSLLVLLSSGITQAQDQEESNLEKFTPSALFGKGTWETNSFYNLYTQNATRNDNGDKINRGRRENFLNIMYQFTYGVSKNARLNVGLDVLVNSAHYDSDPKGNPFKVLLFDDDLFSRTVVSAIGPRVKFVPFNNIGNFSVQSSFLFPIASELETRDGFFTAHDRYTWFTQFFYDQRLNNKWRLFLEADFLYRIKRRDDQFNFFRTPLSAFISYFPSSKVTIFGFGQYSPRFETFNNSDQFSESDPNFDETFGLSQYFSQLGVGLKYQWSKRLGLEVSYSNFIDSKNDGAGYSLNLGFRYIRAR